MKTNATPTVTKKWHGLRTWTVTAALWVLVSLNGLVQAQLTNVIYQDTFARAGLLNGSAPDKVNATGAKYIAGPLVFTGNWTDQNGNTENACYFSNNIPAVPGPLYNVAYLPITVQTGHVYTLTASFLVNTNYTVWWMFLAYASTPSLAALQGQWTAGMLLRSTNNPYGNGNLQCFNGPGTATSVPNTFWITPNGTPCIPQFITLTTVLNLANPAAPVEYWYTNGVAIKTNFPTSLSSVGANNGMWPHYVTFGASNCGGYVTNFTLTDVAPPPSGPTIVEQPNNLTAAQGQTATFWVDAVSDPDPTYQWRTNSGSGWVNIPGATNATYTTPPLSTTYNGLNYSVTVSNVAGSVASSAATLAVTAGNPTVYSVTKTASPTSLVVNFSGAVDSTTSQNAANYSLNNGASVISASAGSVPGSVVLTTSALDPAAAYYLKVQNVKDLFGDAMAAASTNVVLPAGLVLDLRGDSGVRLDASGNVVQWLDQTTNGNHAANFFGWKPSTSGLSLPGITTRPTAGTTINGLPALTFNGANSNFLQAASTPSVSINTNLTIYCVANVSDFAVNNRHFISKNVGNIAASFELDGNNVNSSGLVGPNFLSGSAGVNSVAVGMMSGGGSLVVPHVYAATRAFVTTFTNSWGTVTNYPPALTNWYYTASNMVSLYFDGFQARANVAVNEAAPGLMDGQQPVYIGTRQDHFASDIMNGQIAEILLFNTALSAADLTNVDNYLGQKWFTFTFATAVPTITTSNGFSVTISPGPSAGSTHLNYQWQENGTNIPGANGPSYTTPILAPSDNGDKFTLVVTLYNGLSYTNTTTLNVLNVPPYLTTVGMPIWSRTSIIVTFDIAVDPTTATTAANYSLNNGANVLSAAIGDAPNQVVLTTTPLTWNASPPYTLTVQNVKDLYGNTMAAAAPSVTQYPPNIAVWIQADTGVTTDSGANTVNQWNDLSGNNNHFYQGGGASLEPQLVTNTWGDPVIRFNATDTVTNYMIALNSPTLGITGDMSVIAVVNVRTLASGRNGHIVAKTALAPRANIPAPYDYNVTANPAGQLLRGNGNGTTAGVNYGSYVGTSGPSLGYPYVVAVTETGNTVSHYLNGQPAGTGLLGSNYQVANNYDQGNPVYIGARADFFNRLAGDLAELVVTTSPLSSGDMITLAKNLSAQHHFVLFNPTPTKIAVSAAGGAITLSWPVDHTGWLLQSNSVGLMAPSAWYPVAGSALTNQITITPNASKTNVFYRMFFQQP